MNETWRRLRAYLTGNSEVAEDLAIPAVEDVPWVQAAAQDPESADYAVEAAKRSADFANSAVSQVQDKASALLSVTLVLIPFAAGALAVASSRENSWLRVISIGCFAFVALALAWAALRAFLASGSVLGGGLNIARLSRSGDDSAASLKTREAQTWHWSAQVAMEVATRRSGDLFSARRALIIALGFAGLGTFALSVSEERAGQPPTVPIERESPSGMKTHSDCAVAATGASPPVCLAP